MTTPPDPDRSRFQTDRVASIMGGHAVHDTYTAFLPPLLPAFIQNLALSKTEAGFLYVCLQIPSIFQAAIGYAADRRSLRWAVILGPAMAGLTMTLVGWATTYALLAMLILLAGVNAAAFHAVAPAIAGRLSGPSLGRGMGFWMVGGELGRTLGPLVIVTAVATLTLRGVPWLMLLGFAASGMLYLKLRSLPREMLHQPDRQPWGAVWRRLRPILLPLGAVVTARSFMIASITIFLPTFLTEEGAGLWTAGAALSVLEGAGVAGALVGGWLSDRIGRRRVLWMAQATAPLLLLLFLATSGPARIPVLMALGFTLLSIGPVLMALVQENFADNRALANGIYQSMSFLLRSGAVLVVGLLGDRFGLRVAFATSAGVMLLGLPLVLWLPRGRRVC